MSRPGPRAPNPAQPHPPSKPRSAPRSADTRAVTFFLLRFVGGWLAVLVLFAFAPGIEHWMVRHTIGSLLFVTHLFGVQSQSSGTDLSLSGVSLQIVPDCTPLMPTAALWIAIVAFPAPWRTRLTGLGVGALLLWAYNLVRILALIPVLAHKPELFEFIHVYLWQTVTLLVVFAIFLLWLRLQQPRMSTA